MSNETDLDWLARNVHVWPYEHQAYCYVVTDAGGKKEISASAFSPFFSKFTKDQWLSRRAELQNKPSWNDAPEWAEWLAQDAGGEWRWFDIKPYHRPHPNDDKWNSLGGAKTQFAASGEVLGDWRDTLGRRPEQFNPSIEEANKLAEGFKPFISIEDNQEQDMTQQQAMKQDSGWFERGELPPVGTVCLYVVSDRLSAEVEITAHAKLGLCFVQVGQSGESYVSKTAELHRFRPIRTERDVLIDLLGLSRWFADQTLREELADAILAAGFSLSDK